MNDFILNFIKTINFWLSSFIKTPFQIFHYFTSFIWTVFLIPIIFKFFDYNYLHTAWLLSLSEYNFILNSYIELKELYILLFFLSFLYIVFNSSPYEND